MKKILLLAIILLSLKSISQTASWLPLASGTTTHLLSIATPHPDTCYVSGNSGLIRKTTNGGGSWVSQTTGTSSNLYSICFINTNKGFAVGDAGVIKKTVNGGTNWTNVTATTEALRFVYFYNTSLGFILGTNGLILKTSDGGTSWNATNTGTTSLPTAIFFTSATVGYASGFGGMILKTTDAGDNWSPLTSGTTTPLGINHFTSSANGIVIGDNGLIRQTINSGTNWTSVNSGTSDHLTGMDFMNANNGFIVGGNVSNNTGIMLETNNGGNSWSVSIPGTSRLTRISFASPNIGYAVGLDGTILKYIAPRGVYGNIYNDISQNCIKETNELGLDKRKAFITPGNIIVETASNGMWHLDSLPVGTYTIKVDTSGKWLPTCLTTQNFTVSDSLTFAPSFGFVSTEPCADPEVTVHMPFVRRCFSDQRIYVTACNMAIATGALTNSYVELELDSLLTPGSASLTYTNLGNNLYKFDVGTLNPGECANFWVATTVSCNAVLNKTLCMKANLYPADSCVFDTIPTPPVGGVSPCMLPWDKSSLKVNVLCETDSIYFTITNTGDLGGGDMKCYAPVRIYVDGVYTILDSIKLLGGETITFVFAGEGKTWRLEADQHPLHPGKSHPNATIEACGNPSNWTPNLVNILPLDDADPVVDIYCAQVSGSYDPNDKTGYPLGVGNDHLIYPNGELDYVVRFQNTGTDTAFTVVVRDTLDVDLDIFSVRSGTSSHNYSFKMYGPRVLEWTFNNIMLPDSSADQAGSNGFVTFSVKQNPNLPDGRVINNSVAIYFDFNSPVITNTTTHTIGRNIKQVLPVSTSFNQNKKQYNLIQIYPNPTGHILNVVLSKVQQFNIEMYTIDGRLIDSKTINKNTAFDVSSYTSGMYFIRAISQDGEIYQDKFVKE